MALSISSNPRAEMNTPSRSQATPSAHQPQTDTYKNIKVTPHGRYINICVERPAKQYTYSITGFGTPITKSKTTWNKVWRIKYEASKATRRASSVLELLSLFYPTELPNIPPRKRYLVQGPSRDALHRNLQKVPRTGTFKHLVQESSRRAALGRRRQKVPRTGTFKSYLATKSFKKYLIQGQSRSTLYRDNQGVPCTVTFEGDLAQVTFKRELVTQKTLKVPCTKPVRDRIISSKQ